MNRALLEELYGYIKGIEMPNEQEKRLLLQLTSALSYFKVTSVCRDDLESAGFDISDVSDANMNKLTCKLANYYCKQLFWDSFKIIAGEYFNIPKKDTLRCPICRKHPVNYDEKSNMHYCTYCETDWSDAFVLVKFPEDSDYFEQKNIGYPCFNSEDNGACYIPEYEYLKKFNRHPNIEQYYKPVTWPDSQEYLCDPLYEVITDEKGLKDFGFSSLWMPHKLYSGKTMQ